MKLDIKSWNNSTLMGLGCISAKEWEAIFTNAGLKKIKKEKGNPKYEYGAKHNPGRKEHDERGV